jgi:hypothetical protein
MRHRKSRTRRSRTEKSPSSSTTVRLLGIKPCLTYHYSAHLFCPPPLAHTLAHLTPYTSHPTRYTGRDHVRDAVRLVRGAQEWRGRRRRRRRSAPGLFCRSLSLSLAVFLGIRTCLPQPLFVPDVNPEPQPFFAGSLNREILIRDS